MARVEMISGRECVDIFFVFRHLIKSKNLNKGFLFHFVVQNGISARCAKQCQGLCST